MSQPRESSREATGMPRKPAWCATWQARSPEKEQKSRCATCRSLRKPREVAKRGRKQSRGSLGASERGIFDAMAPALQVCPPVATCEEKNEAPTPVRRLRKKAPRGFPAVFRWFSIVFRWFSKDSRPKSARAGPGGEVGAAAMLCRGDWPRIPDPSLPVTRKLGGQQRFSDVFSTE